eukprot:m.267853 g.267853  ORF g.267853 m.267853 type:complete len:456 (+) comp16251_c0_seq4:205-1572(+)
MRNSLILLLSLVVVITIIVFYNHTGSSHQKEILKHEHDQYEKVFSVLRETQNELKEVTEALEEVRRNREISDKILMEFTEQVKLLAEKEKKLKHEIEESNPIVENNVKAVQNEESKLKGTPTPILVIACNRVTIARALTKLLQYRPSKELFPIIVSQDCGDQKTADVIQEYVRNHGIEHVKQPDLSQPHVQAGHSQFVGYYKIARHYKFALGYIFNRPENYDSVIIVEDDLDVAPDFFHYFLASKAILKKDKTLWCVSAWNDNGKTEHVKNPAKLYRSDFFGGLGWMVLRSLWKDELENKWAESFWDDWMRKNEQRKGRACIRPEVSRTRTFGKIGVSRGQFFDQYLRYIKLNDKFIDFTEMDMTALIKENYDPNFMQQVYTKAKQVTQLELKEMTKCTGGPKRLEYIDSHQFTRIARDFKIMEDDKDGILRTGYMGVVSIRYKGCLLHIAPPQH